MYYQDFSPFSKVQLKNKKHKNTEKKQKQESLAIAKTTARCAIYIAALKILESP